MHADSTAELYLNQILPAEDGGYYRIYDNIFVATMATTGNNRKSHVYAAGVYLGNMNTDLVSINNNYFWQSNPGTSLSPGNPNTDTYVNGSHNRTSFPFGANRYEDPGFAAPAGLPATPPNCAKYDNTTDCMNKGYKVAADLTPTGDALGIGYHAPGPCKPDPYFPLWLKGVVYLHWNGAGVTENSGLITKPCDM